MPIGMLVSGPIAEFFGIYTLFISSLIIQTFILIITWVCSNIRHIDNTNIEPEIEESTDKLEN